MKKCKNRKKRTYKIALISLKDKLFSLKILLSFIVLSDRKFELTLVTFKQLY